MSRTVQDSRVCAEAEEATLVHRSEQTRGPHPVSVADGTSTGLDASHWTTEITKGELFTNVSIKVLISSADFFFGAVIQLWTLATCHPQNWLLTTTTPHPNIGGGGGGLL